MINISIQYNNIKYTFNDIIIIKSNNALTIYTFTMPKIS